MPLGNRAHEDNMDRNKLVDLRDFWFGALLPERPDIPYLRIYHRFNTPELLYYTGSAFGLYFREQKIQFGYVTEAETKARWSKMSAKNKKRYKDLRSRIRYYRIEWTKFWMEECGKSHKFIKTKLDIIKKADEEYIKIRQESARDLARGENKLPVSVLEQMNHVICIKEEEYKYEKIENRNLKFLKRKRDEV